MPTATIKVDLERLEPVRRTVFALMKLLHEVETSDPTMLPDTLVREAADARAIVDEWRRDDRHKRRRNRS